MLGVTANGAVIVAFVTVTAVLIGIVSCDARNDSAATVADYYETTLPKVNDTSVGGGQNRSTSPLISDEFIFADDDVPLQQNDDFDEDDEDEEDVDNLRIFRWRHRHKHAQLVASGPSEQEPPAVAAPFIATNAPSATIDVENDDAYGTTTYSPAFLAEANDYNISNRVVDIFFFTQYCGPSSRLAERVAPPTTFRGGRQVGDERTFRGNNTRVTYAELDVCCRQHDNCPNYITEPEHYANYPGLERRNQYFARMQCSCDGIFYQCLSDLHSRYASAVAIGYGIIQSFCFDFEYPIVRCARRNLWRCELYVVDDSQPKRWQWFDVPPAYKKIFIIPQTMADA